MTLKQFIKKSLNRGAKYNKSAKTPQQQNNGDDAADETSLFSYCFLSSIIPQECGSGNDATTILIKMAMTPQTRQVGLSLLR
jgi:hypothetical protein